jgi:hypothetical protein
MFSDKIKFLFKCNECNLIISVEMEDDADIESARENETDLECNCGGACKPLRD